MKFRVTALSANRIVVLVVWLAALSCLTCYSSDVVYLEESSGQLSSRQRTETASRFYGLDYNVIVLEGKNDSVRAIEALRRARTVAAVISAEALPALNQDQVFAALRRNNSVSVPLLIVGITEQTDPELLVRWSVGAVTACKGPLIENGGGSYRIAAVEDVTRQLSGRKLPIGRGEVRYLVLNSSRGARWIMAASSESRELPMFVTTTIGKQKVFFEAGNSLAETPTTSDPYIEPTIFSALAAPMMFLRYAAGERAWHSVGHYANLTIDDAWLREPYGHVHYEDLLGQMQQHNFHTTIAFIPWNFDRSQLAVVSLFRARNDRFSICIHGDNHDHQEFGSYQSKPLDQQLSNIKQALARMEKFESLTQIPYDMVMVFPHSISPEQTLGALKRFNFLATANSLNVPLGSQAPLNAEFALRTASLAFANFPSLRRYSVEAPMPESQFAVDAFLENPLLFYGHQGFFSAGINAFDETADTVNQLQPDTQWRSLAYIAKHLYLEKLREDGNYDVRAYTSVLHLDNVHPRDAMFFVEKEEDFTFPLTVLVDGRTYAYERSGNHLRVALPVRAGASREMTINYQNDLNIAAIDVSKPSLRINLLRELSDFRDIVVSQTAPGRRLIRAYTDNETAANQAAVAMLIFLLAVLGGAWYVRKSKKRAMCKGPLNTVCPRPGAGRPL